MKSEVGASVLEYTLIVTLIAVTSIFGLESLGLSIKECNEDVAATLSAYGVPSGTYLGNGGGDESFNRDSGSSSSGSGTFGSSGSRNGNDGYDGGGFGGGSFPPAGTTNSTMCRPIQQGGGRNPGTASLVNSVGDDGSGLGGWTP